MRTKSVNSWNEFIAFVKSIISMYNNNIYVLYRGLPDNSWHLSTTLERKCKDRSIHFEKYFDITLKCLPEINSKTNQNFHLNKNEIIDALNSNTNGFELKLPCYNYWIYLRHHGFPSPLLDWTLDYNVASFFSFAKSNVSEYCSIYILIVDPVQVFLTPGPRIWKFGHYTNAHPRHNIQQSMYTIALNEINVNPGVRNLHKCNFISHERIFLASEINQDLLFKVEIPTTEKVSVLNKLKKFGIDYTSLLSRSDDHLINKLACEYFN